NGRIAPEEAATWTEPVMAARRQLLSNGEDLSDLVEPWDPERYNENATVLENLLYGLPTSFVADFGAYARDPQILAMIERSGARPQVESIGWDIAEEFAELVDTVEEESPVLDSFAPYSRDDLQACAELMTEHGARGLGALDEDLKLFVISIALKFVLRRDRLDVLDASRIQRLLSYRKSAHSLVGPDLGVIGFDEEAFNPSRTIAENLLHGSRRMDRKSQWKVLDGKMESAIDAAGLKERLMELGLDRPVGNAGAGLSTPVRRRVALVRALIKRPHLIVLDGVAAGDTPADMDIRTAIRDELPDVTLLYGAENETAAAGADILLTLNDDGRLDT
ncbi:MAG: ATP-binding cassette domain-containing protein, partial [Pseudomonadota bacterium]